MLFKQVYEDLFRQVDPMYHLLSSSVQRSVSFYDEGLIDYALSDIFVKNSLVGNFGEKRKISADDSPQWILMRMEIQVCQKFRN